MISRTRPEPISPARLPARSNSGLSSRAAAAASPSGRPAASASRNAAPPCGSVRTCTSRHGRATSGCSEAFPASVCHWGCHSPHQDQRKRPPIAKYGDCCQLALTTEDRWDALRRLRWRRSLIFVVTPLPRSSPLSSYKPFVIVRWSVRSISLLRAEVRKAESLR
jgi:hypothetical protein